VNHSTLGCFVLSIYYAIGVEIWQQQGCATDLIGQRSAYRSTVTTTPRWSDAVLWGMSRSLGVRSGETQM
jgi:hypothetical protein